MDAGFFKGTSTDQDKRFSDKEAKLLKSIKFPPEFDKKVDMRKVNLQVMRPWVVKKVVELVGFEDEVVVEYAMGLLEDPSKPVPDPKLIQINLTGFLTSNTADFMKELWILLIEAQDSPAGIPRSFVEAKKEEMRNQQVKRDSEDTHRDRLDEIRERERRERAERGGGRGRGRGRGGSRFDERPPPGRDDERGGRGRARDSGWGARGGRSSRPRPLSRSPAPRSPPPRRRRSPSPTPSYESDRSVTPRGSPFFRNHPSSRSPSRSRTPPRRRRRTPSYSKSRSRSRTPPGYARRRYRDSYSPPPRRRYTPSISPPPHRRGRSASYDSRISFPGKERSRSRTPGYHSLRRKSPTRRRSPSRERNTERVPNRKRRRTYSASPPPQRRGKSSRRERSRGPFDRDRSPPPRRQRTSQGPREGDVKMDLDASASQSTANQPSELKIKGSASQNSKKHRPLAERLAEEESTNRTSTEQEKKERELKEAALRNKLLKSKRKNSDNQSAYE